MDLTFLVLLCILGLLTALYGVFKRFEAMVCSEVCAIYCNTIVYIDQLCGINNNILDSWHKFYLKNKMLGERSYNAEKKMLEEILFRKKEIQQMTDNNVNLTFKPSIIKSAILHKHKLNEQEIQAALSLPETTSKELMDNLDFLLCHLKSDTRINSNWLFAENRLKCFQYEANAMYYGALEGLCSFPTKALTIYDQQRTRFKFLPSETRLNKRKEDYLHLQEMEFMKAEDLLHFVEVMVGEDEDKIDILGYQTFSRQVNVFFAGSKSLQTERDIYSNTISQLQTKWKDKYIHLYGYSFQNFEHEFVYNGHQCTYNEFIQRYSDIVIFVLNGNVGGKTKEEFDIAMNAFKEQRRPLIYVYSRLSDAPNVDVERTRDRVNEESQYWQDYADNEQLRLLIKNDLTDRLQTVFEEIVDKRREILE